MMLFHFGFNETVLFSTWTTQGKNGLLWFSLDCTVFFSLSMLNEYLSRLLRHLLSRQKNIPPRPSIDATDTSIDTTDSAVNRINTVADMPLPTVSAYVASVNEHHGKKCLSIQCNDGVN
jgi:hypothetical protein